MTNEKWLKIFPEAINDYILPYVPSKITELEKYKKEIEVVIQKKLQIIRKKSKPKNQWFWEMYVAFWDVEDLLKIEKQIKRFQHLLYVAENINKPIQSKSIGKITKNMIERAESIQIENIVGEIIELKNSGGNWVGLCPFHQEKKPSFFIFTNNNRYKCFGCGEYGNSINFVMKYYGLSFREAVKFLT